MRDSRRNYLIVGIFLLGLLAALLVWLAVLSGRTNATNPYYMEFNNVMGLTEGAQVLYEGYPVGQIEEIILTDHPDSLTYRLNVSIREGWKIPKDSMAVITQAGFLSAVVVDINEGTSPQMLAAGDRIPSFGTTNILTTMSSVASKLGELSDTSLKPLLDNLTEGTSSLKDFSEDVSIILENVKTFSLELNETTDHLNTFLDQSTERVDTILVDVETASGNISDLTTDFRRTEKRLDTLLVSMNDMISKNRAEIDHSVADLHHTLEVVASHVQEISYNLEATTRNMNELTTQIRQNPGILIRGRELNEDPEIGNK